MMVTFVSQCEKKALNRTRRVLDSFANRIGDNTWQTVITNEGLNAVKKLLRKTASKNTAVSCHWIRSRSRSELVWVVGNRNKFNGEGVVPVNTTQKIVLNSQWENNWHYLPLIKVLTALAALFHDWGKASVCFQHKLKSTKIQGDPLRHEWISCLLLKAFIGDVKDDASWLEKLAKVEFDEEILKQILAKNKIQTPLAKLPPVASQVAWLILTHHRLPLPKDKENIKQFNGFPLEHYDNLFTAIDKSFGYENIGTDIELEQCLDFSQGLPSQSGPWIKQIKKWASKALQQQALMEQAMESGAWRLVLHHSRLTLMLGDHYYSSQPEDTKWQSPLMLYANTDRASKQLKQKLDEHLVGVAKNALRTTHLLPVFENEPPRVQGVRALKQKSPGAFAWQDKAANKIKTWRDNNLKQTQSSHFGFFTVNMASTGCGKTFANAKIMQALSEDSDSLRYILALGLRTLTLQTGEEYRKRIGLDNTELAVLIGSKAVTDLHNANKQNHDEKLNTEDLGSESLENLLNEDVDYDCDIPEEGLATVLNCNKDRQFLYAPVLTCTIDHIMSATETRRGGRYILPCLRLMSSDLVIDEIDDFDGDDLVAIGRLIHLAGMLGRKVMISSATIPPDLAKGYFNAYQQGWQLFAKTRSLSQEIGCAWVDEFNTQVQTVTLSAKQTDRQSFHAQHENFIVSRVKKLQQQAARRKANIVGIVTSDTDNNDTLQNDYFHSVMQEIISKHGRHYQIEPYNQKKVSFGVVRMANIKPCVALFEYLINTDWPEDIAVKIMAYHSQQVLLMRSEQEKHLDEVLKRNREHAACEHAYIKKQIAETNAKNVIYILVATPVEEIGRDHDFDWAIVEPSSYRSVIQLAGRVLRHRNEEPIEPNIGLLQYNLKGYQQVFGNNKNKRNPVFKQPGYENKELLLDTHDLHHLLDEQAVATTINAIPRIQRSEQLTPKTSLADLEHLVMANMLTNYQKKGPESLEGWLSQCWWLTALPQTLRQFRKGGKNLNLYLVPENPEDEIMNFVFMEKNDQGRASKAEETQGISHIPFKGNTARLWLQRDYQQLLLAVAEKFDISVRRAALKYGEISVPQYENNSPRFNYSPQSGLVKE